MRRAAGYATWVDPDAPLMLRERDTLQCPHCGGHFAVQPGRSATADAQLGSFCTNCMALCCTKPGCNPPAPCVHFMKRIEQAEAADRLRRQVLGLRV